MLGDASSARQNLLTAFRGRSHLFRDYVKSLNTPTSEVGRVAGVFRTFSSEAGVCATIRRAPSRFPTLEIAARSVALCKCVLQPLGVQAWHRGGGSLVAEVARMIKGQQAWVRIRGAPNDPES